MGVSRRVLVAGAVGALVVPPVPSGRTIVSCAEWGARPPVEPPAVVGRRPTRVLVHHTATENAADRSVAHAHRLARFFQDVHIGRDWGDTGQHFTITRGAHVLEGRHGSLAALRAGDHLVEGAHCPGQNRTSIGVENEGTYTAELPPDEQWDALVWLCATVCRQYGIPPSEIHGHRDHYADTVCPGDALHARLPALRAEVALR
ncbi:peptidoglycan recognition family protein [Actinosynnema sp. NPDC020468]|uniref:peptidoglycan recognition protein family protein n=1 Tax=Actinosynnema sp. NPDC020468 TaxID=3154488 RepID=UPI0034004DD3